MLFSATQTRKVEDLARISLKKEPLYVGVDDNKDKATVDGLEQVLSHKLLHTGQIQRSQFPFHPFYWNPFSISWNHISFTRWSEITETARTQSSFSLLMQWSLSLSLLFQGYVVCPSEKRFLLLFTFLKKNRKKKLMVFFSSCMSVKFHYELLNYIDLPVMAIHVSSPDAAYMNLI